MITYRTMRSQKSNITNGEPYTWRQVSTVRGRAFGNRPPQGGYGAESLSLPRGGMSFVSLDKYFQQGASEFWIRIMLIDLFMVIGAIDATTPYQFKAIAQRIRQQYYHLTPSELTRFFYEFSLGEYEEIFVGRTFNPQKLFKSLDSYMLKLYAKRAEIQSQKLAEQQRREAEEAKKNAISYAEYRRRNAIVPTGFTLESVQDKAKQDSKRKGDT